MKKSIYKLTNIINGKVYIGQSKNVHRRIKEHQHPYESNGVSKIASAIKKYGIQNFSIEILEENIENYNERERYWISYYNSTNSKFGYNIAEGGEDPPIIKGEKSFFAKFTDEKVREIIADIQKGISYKEIEDKYGVNEQYLVALNNGYSRRFDDLSYPICRHGNERTEKQKILEVIDALSETNKSVLQIAKEYNISSSTVYDINTGKCFNCPKDIVYPIRNRLCRMSADKMKELVMDIKDNKLKFSEIETKYNVSKIFVNRVNNGKSHRIEGETYPLRKSSQRVY